MDCAALTACKAVKRKGGTSAAVFAKAGGASNAGSFEAEEGTGAFAARAILGSGLQARRITCAKHPDNKSSTEKRTAFANRNPGCASNRATAD